MKDKEWEEKTAKYILAYRSAAGIRSSRPPMTKKTMTSEDVKREKHRMYEADRRRKHREKLNTKKKEEYQNDPEERERRKQRTREYYAAHRDEMREKNRKREAERRRLKGDEINAKRKELYQNDPERKMKSNQRARNHYYEHRDEILAKKKMKMLESTFSKFQEELES